MGTAWVVVLAVVLAIVVLGVVPYLVATAHRLDRLHVRTDAAWAGLDAALARRAVVARAVAASCEGASSGGGTGWQGRLRAAADHAEYAPRVDREAAENGLTRRLADVERQRVAAALREELADAEHRVVLARRVHNDAVRDTKSLRALRVVRWFRIAGNAEEPDYFEFAEPASAAGVADGEAALVRRLRAARVLLVDGDGRLLLFRGRRAGEDRWWFTPGGRVEVGESLRETAVRELAANTGVVLAAESLVGPVWRRGAVSGSQEGESAGEEWYFLARVPDASTALDAPARAERPSDDGHRWWSVAEMSATGETAYPRQLGELMPNLLASGWDGQLRTVR